MEEIINSLTEYNCLGDYLFTMMVAEISGLDVQLSTAQATDLYRKMMKVFVENNVSFKDTLKALPHLLWLYSPQHIIDMDDYMFGKLVLDLK